MVVILTGRTASAQAVVGRALAAELGWWFEDVHTLANLHRIVERATDRREPAVIAGPPLEPRDRDHLRQDLRGVRIVQVVTGMTPDGPLADLVIEAAQPVETSVATIRNEFGL